MVGADVWLEQMCGLKCSGVVGLCVQCSGADVWVEQMCGLKCSGVVGLCAQCSAVQ